MDRIVETRQVVRLQSSHHGLGLPWICWPLTRHSNKVNAVTVARAFISSIFRLLILPKKEVAIRQISASKLFDQANSAASSV